MRSGTGSDNAASQPAQALTKATAQAGEERDPASQPHYTREGIGTATLGGLEAAGRYNAWIFELVSRRLGDRVLEVGCGTGTMTAFLLDRELVVATDIVETFVESLRARYSDRPNLVAVRHDLTQGLGDLERFQLDSALSVNVFEHIEDDGAALTAVHQLLQPGGTLALLVPAHPFLMGRFDRAIGHHRRYTRDGLAAKLAAAGFEVERIRYSNLLGALGWFALVKLLGRPQLEGIGIFDSLVPLLRRVERFAPIPFGLSLVAVARKPGSPSTA